MPFPHEHSIRVHNPEKYIRIRRQNNRFGNGVHALWGVLRKAVDGAKTEIQALRFDAKKFTPAMVRKWIDAHGGRKLGLVIESATDYGNVGEVYRGNPLSEGVRKNKIIEQLKSMGIENLSIEGEWPRKGKMWILSIPYYKMEALGIDWRNGELLTVVGLGKGRYRIAKQPVRIASQFGEADYRGNPMSKLDVAAWLEAAYHEEKKGIVEYEKLLGYIGNVPEYEGVKRLLKRIIKDEKRHVQALANILKF